MWSGAQKIVSGRAIVQSLQIRKQKTKGLDLKVMLL